jgi:AbrB family looped-hinge helix DNA binding protein
MRRNGMMPKDKVGRSECCQVESIVTVDERGQMVLPKEVRDAAKIRPGDKLALVMWKKGAEVCCVSLIKVEALTSMVKGVLGPMMKDLI